LKQPSAGLRRFKAAPTTDINFLARLTLPGAQWCPHCNTGALAARAGLGFAARGAFVTTEDTMSISARLKTHLDSQGIPFDMIAHPRTITASETAQAAHVPGDQLAKSVLVHLEEGPMLAVVPSNQQVDLHVLQAMLHRRLGLAPESELGDLFDDCDTGAAPPVGAAYDVPVIVDDSLAGLDRIWFEGGDHRTLVTMRGSDFDALMKDAQHGAFCCMH